MAADLVAQLNTIVETEFFLGRQPILDRNGKLVAYELLFRSGHHDGAMVTDDVQATAAVITHAFSCLGVETVLGEHRGFINCNADLLMSDLVELLPPERVVLEILEHVTVTPAVVERCRALSQAGYIIALDDVVHLTAAWRKALPYVGIVKLDLAAITTVGFAALAKELRCFGTRLLAEKVETQEQYERCRALGFDFFQGYFLAMPVVLAGRSAQPSIPLLLTALRLAEAGAAVDDLETVLGQEPHLAERVIKIARAPARRATDGRLNLRSAICTLGWTQIRRIMQVMLLAQKRAHPFSASAP